MRGAPPRAYMPAEGGPARPRAFAYRAAASRGPGPGAGGRGPRAAPGLRKGGAALPAGAGTWRALGGGTEWPDPHSRAEVTGREMTERSGRERRGSGTGTPALAAAAPPAPGTGLEGLGEDRRAAGLTGGERAQRPVGTHLGTAAGPRGVGAPSLLPRQLPHPRRPPGGEGLAARPGGRRARRSQTRPLPRTLQSKSRKLRIPFPWRGGGSRVPRWARSSALSGRDFFCLLVCFLISELFFGRRYGCCLPNGRPLTKRLSTPGDGCAQIFGKRRRRDPTSWEGRRLWGTACALRSGCGFGIGPLELPAPAPRIALIGTLVRISQALRHLPEGGQLKPGWGNPVCAAR